MSRQVNKEVVCPECDHRNKSRLWTGMNVTIDKELRDLVLSERLFDWRCDKCGFTAQLVYPCLYHDMARNFMVYLIPDLNDARLEDPGVNVQFPELAPQRRRVVATLNELKEKVLVFEARLDDMATELTKLAMVNVVERKYNRPVELGYFCSLNKETRAIGYSFLLKGKKVPIYYETRIQVYEKSREVVRDVLRHFPQGPGFSRIDAKWAEKTMHKLSAVAKENT